jgi:hypothetical protein
LNSHIKAARGSAVADFMIVEGLEKYRKSTIEDGLRLWWQEDRYERQMTSRKGENRKPKNPKKIPISDLNRQIEQEKWERGLDTRW